MIEFLKTGLMRFSVGFAEWAGWLTSVDEGLVNAYMNKTEHEINDIIRDDFRDIPFVRAWHCHYAWFCVEVAHKNGRVAVRNSSDPTNTLVVFSLEEWRAF